MKEKVRGKLLRSANPRKWKISTVPENLIGTSTTVKGVEKCKINDIFQNTQLFLQKRFRMDVLPTHLL